MADARTVFLAGAAGAIGSRLLPLLVREGFRVYGTTRKQERVGAIEGSGAKAAVIDIYDSERLTSLVAEIRPEVLIHQLTDLPPGLDPGRMAGATASNALLRTVGTRNLVDSAKKAGTRVFIAQSIAWVYAPGREPHTEEDALDTAAEGARGVTVAGVTALEQAVLADPALDGIVLRYGNLYGPGTGFGERQGPCPLHVDDAASATILALRHRRTGIFNIAEPNAFVSSAKANRELGWQCRPQAVSG